VGTHIEQFVYSSAWARAVTVKPAASKIAQPTPSLIGAADVFMRGLISIAESRIWTFRGDSLPWQQTGAA
jgi:hypothetical protein